MKKLFAVADTYIRESDWKTLAALKFCLCAMGVMLGLLVPREKKKLPFLAAAAVFVVTYIPLMYKFFAILFRSGEPEITLAEEEAAEA